MISVKDSQNTIVQSASLQRVSDGNLCSGCGICEAIAGASIEMLESETGYLRPKQLGDIEEEAEGLISRICPGLSVRQQSAGRTGHPLWGPYESVHVGHASDRALRFRASSGGALSALLASLLSSGKVDGVLQIQASDIIPYANKTSVSSSYADILAAAGSRYAPSAPLSEIARLVGNDKRYAFVGKPCDVAAIRALMEEVPTYKEIFPVLVSFFCAGVPSIKGAEEVVHKMGTAPERVEKFRYRGNGWPGRAVATLADGSTRSMTYHDSWGGILSKHVQHRCKICADGTGNAADIVFADAWEADERGYPLFAEKDGQSLILVRTAKGQEILDGATKDSQIKMEPFNITELEKIQPGQTSRRRALLARLLALRLLGKPIPSYQGFTILAAARTGSLTWSVRNFLGMVRRILQGRAP